MAFVEPLMAINAVNAFRNDSRLSNRDGFRSVHTISTIRRPNWAAIRACAECTAGNVAPPDGIRPRASTTAAIVEAVPMVMHVPGERAIPSSISHQASHPSLPAHRSAQYFHTSLPLPSVSERHRPFSIGPAGRNTQGTSTVKAPINNAGTVLSQPPINTAPSIG